jgi:N-hydroxyarylamine O-acetyltransferase
MAAALKVPFPSVATDVDLDAYFSRIGYSGPRTPTLATLCALAELQPAAIPFEAIDVLLDRGIDLAHAAVDDKLLHRRRGGYCFELNGLLRRVLIALGFEVTGLAARVRWQLPADAPPTPRSHMILRVVVDGEAWLVDAGFGRCTPTTPLNLGSRAAQRTTHETFRIAECARGLRLEVQSGDDWHPVYEFDEAPQLDVDYAGYNWYTSTHPSSHFRHTLIVARTTAWARHTLRDNRMSVRNEDGRQRTEVLDADGIERVLAEVFGLAVEPAWRAVIERSARGAD